MAARGLGRGAVQRAPQPPALLPSQPRAHELRRAPQRGAHVLPVIDRTAVHLPRVPTAPHQPGRLLAIRALAPFTAVPLHPHPLPPPERPRPPRIAAPLARHRFFFSSRRRHTRLVSDWSSDVCSSDLRSIHAPATLGFLVWWPRMRFS